MIDSDISDASFLKEAGEKWTWYMTKLTNSL